MTAARRLLISPLARRDLEDIDDYISQESPARARAFIGRLEQACERAARSPSRYPRRDNLAPGLRVVIIGRYLIFFRDLAETNIVRIERVLHGARDLPRLF